MKEFCMEMEVGDASPLSFFSSFFSVFSFSAVAVSDNAFLSVKLRPFYKVILFLLGDGDSSSILVGDLWSYS